MTRAVSGVAKEKISLHLFGEDVRVRLRARRRVERNGTGIRGPFIHEKLDEHDREESAHKDHSDAGAQKRTLIGQPIDNRTDDEFR